MTKDQIAAEDLGLLKLVAEGDQHAMAVLHRRHAPLCARRAFEVLRDQALADDAVQEAFLDLWRTAERFDARRASVRTWLCVLVNRRAIDIARREARWRLENERAASIEPASYTAEELLILQLDRRRVRTALTQLNTNQREVLELSYYGGLTQSQLATRLELPLGTIKSRTSEALSRLAALLNSPHREILPHGS